jgi:hypothetical protein
VLAGQRYRRSILGVAFVLVLDDLAHFGGRVAILARQHYRLGIRIPIGAAIFIVQARAKHTRAAVFEGWLGSGGAGRLGHGGGPGMIGVGARPLGRSSRLRGGGLGNILRIHVI